LALATIIPELFSGSTPPASFLNPRLFIFLFLGYGLAILLVRELGVRWHCGVFGLFFLGLAYSIFNEGLLAKTLVLEKGLPVPLYDHYGYVLGISLPWAAGIGTWHAYASVIFPILFTHYFFPKAREKPWLNTKIALVLGLLLMLLACTAFLGTSEKGVKGTPGQLAVLLLVMFIGFVLARVLTRISHGSFHSNRPEPCEKSGLEGQVRYGTGASAIQPLLLGLSVLVPFWALALLAASKVPLGVFFGALVGIILFYAWILKRRHWLDLPSLLFFAIGWYLHNAIQAAIIILSIPGHSPGRVLITVMLDGLILFLLFRQIHRVDGAEIPVQKEPPLTER